MSVPACSGSCYFCRGEPATCGKTVARARCLPCGHTPMQCKTANMSPRALHGLRIHPTSSRTLQNHSRPLRKTQRPFQQHLRTAQRLLHNHNWFNSIHTNHQNTHQYESIVAAFICFIASLTRLKHLSETRICTCLHMSTTCLSHHDLNCGDESSQECL